MYFCLKFICKRALLTYSNLIDLLLVVFFLSPFLFIQDFLWF